MTTQGPLYAATIADDAGTGTGSWTNPTNAGAVDSSYATANMSPSQTSHYLKFTNFGFTIPAGATITNILVEIIRKANISSNTLDAAVRQVKAGTIGTVDFLNVSYWATSDETVTYSGLFEGSWTYSDINDSGFGWALSCVNGASGATASVDAIRITVTYSTVSAVLTGTAIESETNKFRESHVVAGGKTIIVTLTNDTWVAAGATFDAQRQNIINGMDSAQAEATGWDAEVKAKIAVTDVVRTSSTVVTITLDAEAAYNITAAETITVTIPSTALTGAAAVVATPTFRVLPDYNKISHLGGLLIGGRRQPRKLAGARRLIQPGGRKQRPR